MNDEYLYEIVIEELRNSGPKPGLWAKAFSESKGQESMAKALYMRYRVEQLAALEREAKFHKAEHEAENKRNAWIETERQRNTEAKAEGITSIHLILCFLFVLVTALIILQNGDII